jgi:hypothetical protein
VAIPSLVRISGGHANMKYVDAAAGHIF